MPIARATTSGGKQTIHDVAEKDSRKGRQAAEQTRHDIKYCINARVSKGVIDVAVRRKIRSCRTKTKGEMGSFIRGNERGTASQLPSHFV